MCVLADICQVKSTALVEYVVRLGEVGGFVVVLCDGKWIDSTVGRHDGEGRMFVTLGPNAEIKIQ